MGLLQREAPGTLATVAGLTAATAAAYGVFLLGRRGARRPPPTESMQTLPLPLRYQQWTPGRYYAYYWRDGDGTPVVLLHGIHPYATAGELAPLVPLHGSARDRPLFALEWIGFGHSDRPEISYVPETFENQLSHFLRTCVGRPAVLVASGAAVGYAAAVAVRHPSRVLGLVGLEPLPVDPEVDGIGSGWARLLFTVPGVQRALFDRIAAARGVRAFYARTFFPEGDVPEDLVRFGAEAGRIEGAARPLDDILQRFVYPGDLCAMLERMQQPVLVLHGSDDARRIEAYRDPCGLAAKRNAAVEAVEGGGMFHWEAPGAVGRHIAEFIEHASEATS